MEPSRYLEHVRDDVEALRRLAREPDRLLTPVPTCPGWRVGDVLGHLGAIERWVGVVLRTSRPAPQPDPPADPRAAAAWFLEGTDAFLAALAEIDPDEPCWNFGPEPHLAGFWLRRQAHEHAVHRDDLAQALGREHPVDPGLADDGVDEVVTVTYPRQVRRGHRAPVGVVLRLDATDTGRRHHLRGDGTVAPAGAEEIRADARLAGPAAALYRLVWGRLADRGQVTVTGDEAAVDRLLGPGLTP